MRYSYVVMQSVATRRHADIDPRVISHALLTNADMQLVPILKPDWLTIFEQPWIPPGERFFPKSPWV